MKAQRKDLAAFTIILGVLTLILTVSALAEKAHGDHLPERNGRGTAEAVITSGLPAGILILLSAVSGSVSRTNRCKTRTGSITLRSPSRCTTGDTLFALQWPMRSQPAMTTVYH
jgi:hypothetical protein